MPLNVAIDTSRYSAINGAGGPITGAPTDPAPPSTSFISCKHQNQDPGLGITQAYCVCSGSTFSETVATQVTPHNSCGYTTMPSVTLGGGNTLPATTNTAECKVCSVVGNNNNVCTSLANCTPQTTVNPPPPAPTPSGSLCLVQWASAFPDGSNSFSYGVFKPGDACSNANSVEIGNPFAGHVCGLGSDDDQNPFKVCGKNARFVNEGPVFENIEDGDSCGLQLQIDGVNYAGSLVDATAEPCSVTCAVGVAFGNSLGRIIFKDVPICD